MEGHCPDKLGGICDKGYHGLQGASRWFCKIYCDKAVIVGLMKSEVQSTVAVDQHLMGIRTEVVRSQLPHLVLDEIQPLLVQADFLADGSRAVWHIKELLSLYNGHF